MAHWYTPTIIEMLLQLDSEDIGQLVVAYLQQLPNNGTHICEVVEEIMRALIVHSASKGPARQWACNTASMVYTSQILALLKKSSDLHFGASSARADQLNNFNLDGLVIQFQTGAPDLWRCYECLLAADPATNSLRERQQHQRMEVKAAAHKVMMAQFHSREGCESDGHDDDIDKLSESDDEEDPMLSDCASKARELTMTIVSRTSNE